MSDLIAPAPAPVGGIPAKSEQDSISREKYLLAAFLSPLLPGVGHFLVRRFRSGTLLLVFYAGLLSICWPLRLLDRQPGLVVFAFGLILLCIFAAVNAGYANRNRPSQLLLLALLPFAFVAAAGHINLASIAAGFQTFEVPSRSMENTVPLGAHLMVDRWYYKHAAPNDGDIAIYLNPEGLYLIKRVIAKGGETIECRDGQVSVDGKPIHEPYVIHSRASADYEMNNFGPVKVPEGKLFVMGDNRDISLDSRSPAIGPVEVSSLRGKPLYTLPGMKGTRTNRSLIESSP